MEMLQFLEADKEQVRSGLVKAGTPEQAQTVLEKEFDKLLLQYNEECVEERVRNEARHMTQAAKMMIPLISAAGETKIWSKSVGGPGAGGMKLTKKSIACIAGGALFLVAAIVSLALSAGSSLTASALLGAIPAAILGGALLFLGGRLSLELKAGGSDARQNDETYQVEIRVDPDRVWSCLRAAVLSIDKGLQEARESVNYERRPFGERLQPEGRSCGRFRGTGDDLPGPVLPAPQTGGDGRLRRRQKRMVRTSSGQTGYDDPACAGQGRGAGAQGPRGLSAVTVQDRSAVTGGNCTEMGDLLWNAIMDLTSETRRAPSPI